MIIDAHLLHRLLRALSHVYDEDYQRRAWLGFGPEVSSPDETFNEIYDDCHLMDVINFSENILSKKTLSRLIKLDRLMHLISFEELRPSLLIENPAWIEVRQAANEAALALREDVRVN